MKASMLAQLSTALSAGLALLPALRIIHEQATQPALRDLADQMFAMLKETRQTHWLSEAFSTLPTIVMTPNAAYQHLVKDQIERLRSTSAETVH